jgi:hypothetical protein
VSVSKCELTNVQSHARAWSRDVVHATTLTESRVATLEPESLSAGAGSTNIESSSTGARSTGAGTRPRGTLSPIGARELGPGGRAQRVGRPTATVPRRRDDNGLGLSRIDQKPEP